MRRIGSLILLSCLMIALSAASARAATFPVNSTADDTDLKPGDGFCSTDVGACTLRAAVQEANALGGPDIIELPPGTYSLDHTGIDENAAASGDLDLLAPGLAQSLTINGAGARSTIISGVGDRVFEIRDSALTVNISGVTISGGSAVDQGGGILNNGILNLTDSMVLGNKVNDPFGSNQGAGIFNGNQMTLRNVTIAGNVGERGLMSSFGPQGGGLFDAASVASTITNVTVSGNEVSGSGAQGGGVFFLNVAKPAVTNATIAGNLTPASGAGGGLFVLDPLTIVNSIVAGNLGGSTPDNCAGDISTELLSQGNNLESGTDCDFTAAGDLQNRDPLLGALGDNGGPTDTRALSPGSPAVDAGNTAACPPTDQRGIARPFGPACDIGAFEFFVAAPVDSDGDGLVDPLDACPTVPANTANGCPLGPPVLGRAVNVRLIRGVVLLGLPRGAARAAGVRASQKGITFVPLTQDRQIPVGSFLDTKRGTVELRSATGSGKRTQSGKFSAGLFQVRQSKKRSARGLTDLVMKGGSFKRCGGKVGRSASAALSRRQIRRLRSSVSGRFRTSGRNSSATVRGTVWTITDRCDGTLTQVKRGAVVVRDFRRKRNITLRAGKSYLAKARR